MTLYNKSGRISERKHQAREFNVKISLEDLFSRLFTETEGAYFYETSMLHVWPQWCPFHMAFKTCKLMVDEGDRI